MRRKMILLVSTSVIAFLLSGCFTELPVRHYSIKQEAVAKASPPPGKESTPARAVKPKGRAETPAPSGAGASTERRIEELEKTNQALLRRLDLYEQRITELEKRLKTAK